jgi:hypothetical protein
LKLQISQKVGIRPEEQKLFFKPLGLGDRIALDDDTTVGDSGIQWQSVIKLSRLTPHGITTVTIPSGVTTLDRAIFRRFCPDDGVKVSLRFAPGSRLVEIAELCFEGCVTLQAICIPRLVQILPTACFSGAHIETVTFESDSHLTTIGCECFKGCISLTSINIPRRVTTLGAQCFSAAQIGQMTFEHESKLAEIGRSCFRYCQLQSIDIPSWVEILGAKCFAGDKNRRTVVGAVTFGIRSCLRRIEESCFQYCLLRSIVIPRSLTFISKFCFFGSNIEIITFESDSRLRQIQEKCFHSCSLQSIKIPKSIEIIGKSCFSRSKMEKMTFCVGSRLTRLPESCFVCCSMTSIVIPCSVEILGQLCFSKATVGTIIFEAGSRMTRIEDSCFQGCSLKSMDIPHSVEFLGQLCFSEGTIGTITFEAGSRMTRVEDSCFQGCSLRLINIPKSVEILGKSCFSSAHIEIVAIEKGSRLTRIETNCFSGCSLGSFVVPASIEFISGTAFPRSCSLQMDGSERCHRFDAWNRRRQSGSSADFDRFSSPAFVVDGQQFWIEANPDLPFCQLKRILSRDLNLYGNFSVLVDDCEVDDEVTLNDLKDLNELIVRRSRRPDHPSQWVIDISEYEPQRELEENSLFPVELCRHRNTGHEIVVKTFPRIRHEDIFKRELEALMRVDHPCIVPLFGCVLRAGREGPMIVTHFMESDSLAKALRTSPAWLTETMKTIIVVGIVVGMIEVHKAGFIHRDLKPANIVLDGNHRPRICDFGSSRHEMLSETMTCGVGTMNYMAPELFRNVDHTNRVDVYSFTLILYEVIVGQAVFGRDVTTPDILHQHTKRDPVAIPVDVEGFVGDLLHRGWSPTAEERPSFEDILDSLSRNNFSIMGGIDMQEVESYLDWVKKCHRRNPA